MSTPLAYNPEGLLIGILRILILFIKSYYLPRIQNYC